jgi:magnesium chelatase family protein
MVTRVSTVAFEGIEARAVDVQVQITPGAVAFMIVGLPDKAVGRIPRTGSLGAHRIRPRPAGQAHYGQPGSGRPAQGGQPLDLPIALAVMAAIGAIPADALQGFTVLGELALDGSITSVAGVLPAAMAAYGRGHGLICPEACGPEAAWAGSDIDILAPRSLIQLANHFKGAQVLKRPEPAIMPGPGLLPI